MAHTVPASERTPLIDKITEVEQQMVLQAFAELKTRKAGELRIAIRHDEATGTKQIVYIGVHEPQNLDKLRKLYSQLIGNGRNGALTFGER
jgi:hypothetical protein